MTYETVTLKSNPANVVMSEDHKARLNELETLRTEIVSKYDGYTADQLTFKPEPGYWNLLQVLDHIVTSEKMSAIYIKRQLNGKKYPPPPGLKSRFRYSLLKVALKLPFRYKAPSIVDSTGKTPDLHILQESWKTIRGEIQTIIETTDEELLNLGVYEHPRAGLLNMEQALDFLDMHIRHHKKQMERITGHENFPG
ncbi:DinB family protein [Rhodohalobacter sp. 8-1]|uniref:DinB family protein n=1 Tax=Rhodohalobacter sp. 8-1 TaxID=3131972 RepID=UPI0030EC01CC